MLLPIVLSLAKRRECLTRMEVRCQALSFGGCLEFNKKTEKKYVLGDGEQMVMLQNVTLNLTQQALTAHW